LELGARSWAGTHVGITSRALLRPLALLVGPILVLLALNLLFVIAINVDVFNAFLSQLFLEGVVRALCTA